MTEQDRNQKARALAYTSALRQTAGATDAVEALKHLFFIIERLDRMAQEPGPDGMLKVTASMWRDQISPSVRAVREALDR